MTNVENLKYIKFIKDWQDEFNAVTGVYAFFPVMVTPKYDENIHRSPLGVFEDVLAGDSSLDGYAVEVSAEEFAKHLNITVSQLEYISDLLNSLKDKDTKLHEEPNFLMAKSFLDSLNY